MSGASKQVVRGAGGRSRQPWIFLGCPAPGRPQQLLVSAEENSEGTLGFTAMVVGSPLRPKNKWVVSAHGAMSVSWNMPHRHARVALDGHARPCAGLRVGPGLPAAEPACVGV